MSLALCMVFWLLGLGLQAACEHKMLRFARLPEEILPRPARIGRVVFPLLGLVIAFWLEPITAIFLWVGAFSMASVIVALVWAILARYQELKR